jgi:hypothetical protein
MLLFYSFALNKIRIGTESRHPIEGTNQMAPGPGSYHFEGSMQVSAPSIKIGTAQRKFIADGIPTPGPGAYDVKRIVAEGPRAVFMRSRSRDHQGLAGPDPGSYTPNIDLVR